MRLYVHNNQKPSEWTVERIAATVLLCQHPAVHSGRARIGQAIVAWHSGVLIRLSVRVGAQRLTVPRA